MIGVAEESVANWERERSHPQVRHYPAIIAFLGYCPFMHKPETISVEIDLHTQL
jgi:DNA-binding XRE family transcriptional regulator